VSIRIRAKTITPATAKIRFIEAPFGIRLDIHYDFLTRAIVQKSHNAQHLRRRQNCSVMTVKDHARSNARRICSGGVGSGYALLIVRALMAM
jgi:hypothetical protein